MFRAYETLCQHPAALRMQMKLKTHEFLAYFDREVFWESEVVDRAAHITD